MFWAENSLNVGGFLAKVTHRTGFISNFDVFFFQFLLTKLLKNEKSTVF